MAEKNILAIVEGERKEPFLLNKLFEVYHKDENLHVYSYCTNIYALYDYLKNEYQINFGEAQDDFDFLQILKEREPDQEKKKIFDISYTDILLVFDFDPQDKRFSKTPLLEMMDFFNNSTECGRLYFNYPMVESCIDIQSFTDDSYLKSVVNISELNRYKDIAQNRSCCPDMRRYGKNEFSRIIDLNLRKTAYILASPDYVKMTDDSYNALRKVLSLQINLLNRKSYFYILNTCLFFMYDYLGPKMIDWLHRG